MDNTEGTSVYEQASQWIESRLEAGGKTVAWLVNVTKIDKGQLVRGLKRQRKLAFHEVVEISRALGEVPPPWNKIEKTESVGRLIPLYGSVSSAVWRVKGAPMAVGVSPIEPIGTREERNQGEQFCFIIEDGDCAGQYAVCVGVSGSVEDLEDGDVVIAEQTRIADLPDPTELAHTSMWSVFRKDGRVRLESWGDFGAKAEISPGDGVEIRGRVVGIFLPMRRGEKVKTAPSA